MTIRVLEVETGFATPCHVPVRRDGAVRVPHPDGYVKGKYTKGLPSGLHARAWIESNGPIQDGLVIDHLCRHRPCCNVAHMELVTPTENLRRGDVAKLTMEKVIELRAMRGAGMKCVEIARILGVSVSVVSRTSRGENWADGECPAWNKVKARRECSRVEQ